MKTRETGSISPAQVWDQVRAWRRLAAGALARMYRPEEKVFAFRLRRGPDGDDLLEGVSGRYTAIVLIALATEPPDTAAAVLHGQNLREVCGRLIARCLHTEELGEVALTSWTARLLAHPDAEIALERLRALRPAEGPYPTVEISWALAALCANSPAPTDPRLADRLAERLLRSFCAESELFPHWPAGIPSRWPRRHVCCFADVVYPVQALSYYSADKSREDAIEAARRCARRMCRLQGPNGQWWWHYDVRNGRVLERYPVYAVHQDAMGPMALLALEEACGQKHDEAIVRSVVWMINPPELDGSLVDGEFGVIWRKVARREPGKLVRSWQALASSLHHELRVPGVDMLFPPGRVDYESRPYHMAWLLHAFSEPRVARLAGDALLSRKLAG